MGRIAMDEPDIRKRAIADLVQEPIVEDFTVVAVIYNYTYKHGGINVTLDWKYNKQDIFIHRGIKDFFLNKICDPSQTLRGTLLVAKFNFGKVVEIYSIDKNAVLRIPQYEVDPVIIAEELDLNYTESSKDPDPINHPNHYTHGGIECIDYLKAKLTDSEFTGFLKGNIIKYLSRAELKNGVEDYKKAKWYLDELIKMKESYGNQ